MSALTVCKLQVNKYLKEVQGYSFRICVELDHVLSLQKQNPINPTVLKSKLFCFTRRRGHCCSVADFMNVRTPPSDSEHISSLLVFSPQRCWTET
jgi:hypothetical protein